MRRVNPITLFSSHLLAFGAVLGLVLFGSLSSLHAECVPSEDPCAPKKKTGDWDVSGLFGFNFTSGNTDTTLLTVGAKGLLDKDNNLWEVSADYSFGKDDEREDPKFDDTTRNDFRALVRYDRLLSERFYIGLGSKFLYDEIAEVDYRVNIDPNIGYFLLKDNTYKFRVEGGPSYVFEEVGDIEDDYFAPRLAERFDWAITCTSKFYQQAEVFMDIDDSDNYVVNAEVGVEAALSSQLSLALLIRQTYDNVPAAGREKDDLAVISALKVAL